MLSFIISKDILKKMLKENRDDLVIVDLREKQEYEEYHIDGAINYSYNLLMKSNYFEDIIIKDKKIILYCERGGRSIYATRKLRGMGYNVTSLQGGVENYLEN